jgi:NAD(P)H dehydrogenase (quinone)
MNILIVFAHPEPNSLNGVMKDLAAKILRDNGHEVKISDLYRMHFKSTLDQGDFSQRKDESIFSPIVEQLNAAGAGSLAEDIKDEMKKVEWADILIFQFPVWWTSFPAIMKGWIDRVLANGFAFDSSKEKYYEYGLLKGKKAMLSFTTGAPKDAYSKNGPHGDINELFKYITHTTLELVGLEVLPSFTIFGPSLMSKSEVKKHFEEYGNVLQSL